MLVVAFVLTSVAPLVAQPGGGRRGFRPSSTDPNFFKSVPAPMDESEKKILDVLDDMDKTQRRGNMNVPVDDGRLLRMLAEMSNAKHVVEIGTSTGYSGIWFCLALRKTEGKLTTYEIDKDRAAKARENFKRAGVESLVTLVEGNAHDEIVKLEGPIDIVFLDADKEGYLDYLEKLMPKLRPGGLVVAHNINTRQADPKYIKAITTNPALDSILTQTHLSGVSISLKKR